MKRLTLFRLSLFALLCCTLALAACSDSDVPATDGTNGEGSAAGKYISISVSAGGTMASRGTQRDGTPNPPNGGEDGDGNEHGNANESTVSKVSILLYKAPEGVTSLPTEGVINVADDVAENIPVTVFCWSTYLKETTTSGSDTEEIYTTGSRAIDADIPVGTYKILVVANTDLSGLNGRSLAFVRQYVVEKEPFDRGNTDFTSNFDPASCKDFIMSSYKEQTLVIGNGTGHCGSGSQADPYVVASGAIELERLAARIDYATNVTNDDMTIDPNCQWNETDQTYDYAVWKEERYYDDDEQEYYTEPVHVATFKLKYVVPFNLTQVSYLFKHTTTGTDLNTCNYMGRETDETKTSGSWNMHYNTNYVLDPFTLLKGKTENLSNFYIPLVYHHSLTDHAEDLSSTFKSSFRVKPVSQMSYDVANGRNYYTLGYSAENTLTVATQQSTDPGIATFVAGIRFFGYYVPDSNPDKAEWIAYDYYIRHSSPEEAVDLSKPMTYGLVRNNIYRVYINKISAIAGKLDFNIKLHSVPWQKYEHEEIVM